MTIAYGAHVPVGERALTLIAENAPIAPLEIAASLSGLWLPALLMGALLFSARKFIALGLVVVAATMIVTAAMAVEDIDRSLAYLFPGALALVGAITLPQHQGRALLSIAALICLITPVNAYVGVAGPVTRYAEGNLMPIELYRAWSVATQR